MQVEDKLVTFINHERVEISPSDSFTTLAEYLRYQKGLCGTKIVCAEGDCGACTVLIKKDNEYKSVNSCVMPMYLTHGQHIVTVEGVNANSESELHPVQAAMIEHQGAQCGYCTPGFICALTGFVDACNEQGKQITEKRVKNCLTGNLCRCTGYLPIINAACAIKQQEVKSLKSRYENPAREQECAALSQKSVNIENKIFLPVTLAEALKIKQTQPNVKIISGATDVGVLVNKGKLETSKIIALYKIQELNKIDIESESIKIGACVSLTKLEKFIEEHVPEFKSLIHIFASPQIKNQGTLIGNALNASPIGDTIPFLLVSEAVVAIASKQDGTRFVPLSKFYLGYRQVDLNPNEIVTHIHIPIPKKENILKLCKVSVRKDLDISAVTFAALLTLGDDNKISSLHLAFGGIAATVLRMTEIEQFLFQKKFSRENIEQASFLLPILVTPLSDVRGSKEYRLQLCKNLLLKFYDEVGSQL